jgi:glycosyltransferase involved in cell wall biosynthesis
MNKITVLLLSQGYHIKMSRNSLVSVVMIFFNEVRFIQEAIDSVLAQTYSDWELLLVDDGSSDGSSEIALSFAAKQPNRISYLEHSAHANRGMSASRNLGISHARGEFIALLDADDVWLPPKLEHQVALMQRYPDVGLLFSPAYIWMKGVKTPQEIWLTPGEVSRATWLTSLLAEDWGASPLTNTVIIRREVILAVRGAEDAFRGLYEDQALWIKIALRSPVYYDGGQGVALYRIHPDSACQSTPNPLVLAEMLSFRRWVVKYLEHHDAKLKSHLPIMMARCNLFNTLLLLVNESAASRFGRIRKSVALVRNERYLLGHWLSVLLIFGAVFGQAASTAAEGIRGFCKIAHTQGLRRSLRVIPKYSVLTLKAMFPLFLKRSLSHFLARCKSIG